MSAPGSTSSPTPHGQPVGGRERAVPVRLRLSRAPGSDIQAASRRINDLPAVVVGRPSVYGNPFTVAMARGYLADVKAAGLLTRDERPHAVAVRWFEEWIAGDAGLAFDLGRQPLSADRIQALRGKNLACWCALPAPGEPDHCHAAVLLRLANPISCDALPPTPAPPHEAVEGEASA